MELEHSSKIWSKNKLQQREKKNLGKVELKKKSDRLTFTIQRQKIEAMKCQHATAITVL